MKTALAVSLWLLVLGANMSYCYSDNVDALLKRLNKPALKSIMSLDGDIIDCVHISQQPALDHPSLKNHSIQMRPSYIPGGLANGKEGSIKQMWHLNGSCPKETIPIRRTTREDIVRASTASTKYKTSKLGSGFERAITHLEGSPYYGTKATINLWDPIVRAEVEYSSSQIWVKGGSEISDLNTIEAGWQIYPAVYADHNTRLFIRWTNDGHQTSGCYDLKCAGFVQTDNTIALGGTITPGEVLSPVSQYNGAQYVVTIYIWKDSKEEKWWLYVNDIVVGYWPTNLFTHLDSSSDLLEWGGEVLDVNTNGQHTTTQMGSGHFPSEGYRKASFFNEIQIVNSEGTLMPAQNLITSATNPTCYNVEIGQPTFPCVGTYFFYGGPGQNSECP